ncbi:hypothetical protein GCM10022419_118180 [Nonomuraea rosea]|uniref:Sigma-70 family RNA polymerase sigma factor n=1 Tax=Nonomuraea rosea TaxID=638574 RepID=A0ABP6ZMG9_9ACTN
MATDDHLPVPVEHLPGSTEDGVVARTEFLDFYDREYHLLVRFLMYCGAPRIDAEDATQQAFVEVWARWGRGQGEIKKPSLYLRKVAYRRYLRPHGPRRQPFPISMGEPPDRPVPDHAGPAAEFLDVLAVLRELDDNSRIVMALCMDGYTSVEIAEQLGISAQKVRDLLKKARKALKARL